MVEDEPLVRNLVAQVLRDQGYTVLEAANGIEAISIAEKHQAKSTFPTSPSGSASARLTQNQAAKMSSPDSSVGVRFTQYRAPSIPGEFTSAGRTRISSAISYP